MGRKKGNPNNKDNARCKVGNNSQIGCVSRMGSVMPSLYAGGRIHKMRWRKRRPLEPHYEGPLMQMKLKL